VCRACLGADDLLDTNPALAAVARRVLACRPAQPRPDEDAPLGERLRALLPGLDQQAVAPQPLRANIARLSDVFGFDPLERLILELSVQLQSDPLLQAFSQALGERDPMQLHAVIAAMLAAPLDAVETALRPCGRLQGSGILDVRDDQSRLPWHLAPLSAALARDLATPGIDPLAALRETIVPCPAPVLTLADYAHLGALLDVAVHHLRQALAQRRTGVNVLLYGPPGTGKTELSRVLGAALDCEVYALACADREGQPIGGHSRLRRYRAAQALLSFQPALLVFDELDDVLHDDGNLRRPPPGSGGLVKTLKSWMNQAVETNVVPTVWICNDIGGFDPAFLRRIDVVLQLPAPPRAVRRAIVDRACGGLADSATIEALAAQPHLTPAIVTRAAQIVQGVHDSLGADRTAGALRDLIDGTLRAQGHAVPTRRKPRPADIPFDLRWVNTEADLRALAEGIARVNDARLLLDGPAGTGKTGFAHWLADRLDRPLQVHRTSDLLSPWVGATEKALATAFRRAEGDGAVLLIDEIDSLLADRSHAQQSWEVSQVNELLCQMDEFEGVFIATTNRPQSIDAAALRRFEVKLTFEVLREDQAWDLFQAQCAALGLQAPQTLRAALARLDRLTPGDFAVVARRARLRQTSSPDRLLADLAAECARKPAGAQAIGFVTSTNRSRLAPQPDPPAASA
jgi:SpoVK/Ycf46/Vps4 family AAA+-type ATPase